MSMTERLRAVVAILLLVGAALFIVGVAVERAVVADESTSESEHHEVGSGTEGSESATTVSESSAETILGIDVESWPLAIALATVSIGVAFTVWRGRLRAVLLAAALFALALAVLDIREAIHQESESRTGIMALAGLIALTHLAAAALAAFAATRTATPAVS
jgi:hypothetical protein